MGEGDEVGVGRSSGAVVVCWPADKARGGRAGPGRTAGPGPVVVDHASSSRLPVTEQRAAAAAAAASVCVSVTQTSSCESPSTTNNNDYNN